MGVRPALIALIVFAATPALGWEYWGGDRPKTEDKTPKVDEKAYKDALKRIPEPKEKYDPWSGARPATDQKTK